MIIKIIILRLNIINKLIYLNIKTKKTDNNTEHFIRNEKKVLFKNRVNFMLD